MVRLWKLARNSEDVWVFIKLLSHSHQLLMLRLKLLTVFKELFSLSINVFAAYLDFFPVNHNFFLERIESFNQLSRRWWFCSAQLSVLPTLSSDLIFLLLKPINKRRDLLFLFLNIQLADVLRRLELLISGNEVFKICVVFMPLLHYLFTPLEKLVAVEVFCQLLCDLVSSVWLWLTLHNHYSL